MVSCVLDVLISRLADSQLRELLGEVLAIPNADTLPTPNARKTCALAIWVIQVQRLSRPILQPLAFRIAHVIRRGIDGELGKEGKKGSASDGLKVRCFTCFDINELTKIRLYSQTDGQIEQINQKIGTFLRYYVNYQQDNWTK